MPYVRNGLLTMLVMGLLLAGTGGCHRRPLVYQAPTPPLLNGDIDNSLEYDNRHIPHTLRKVAQYRQGELLNVLEYDRRGRLIFKYYKQNWGGFWDGRYLTMLTANVYEGNRLARTYYLHSNAGLGVRYYDYNWLETKLTSHGRANDYDDTLVRANDNPFRFIDAITSRQALLAHPRIIELEKRAPKRLAEQIVYDFSGKETTRTYFNEQEQPAYSISYSYEGEHLIGDQTHMYGNGRDTNTRYRYTRHQQQLQEVLTTDSQGDTTFRRQGCYGPQGELMQYLEFEQKLPAEPGPGSYSRYGKIVFHYEAPQVMSRLDYYTVALHGNCQTNCAPQLHTSIRYRRNKEGFVTESQKTDYQTGQKETNSYRYIYWYF